MFFCGLIESFTVTGTAKALQEGYRWPAVARTWAGLLMKLRIIGCCF